MSAINPTASEVSLEEETSVEDHLFPTHVVKGFSHF